MELFYCNMTTFWVAPWVCIDLEMVPDILLQSAWAEVADRYGWVVIQQVHACLHAWAASGYFAQYMVLDNCGGVEVFCSVFPSTRGIHFEQK